MKNRILLLLLMALLVPWTAFAQSEFTFGDDAISTSRADSPYGGLFGFEYHVYLYDAADMDFSGTVTSVSFKSSSSSGANETANYTLYLKDVPSTTTLSLSTTFAEFTAGLTPVFSSTTMPALAEGWNTTTLTNTFEHQSGNSILVMARAEGCSLSGGCSKYVYYEDKSRHAWHKKADNTDPGPNVSGDNLNASAVSIKFTGYITTPYYIPFEEDFSTSSIPSNWARYSGLLSDVMAGTATLSPVTNGWYFGPSNGVFDNHARLNIWSNSTRFWLVTPKVAIENNCQLSFELALTQYSGTLQPVDPTQQADDRFVVLASTDGGSTWTILREWNNTGSPYVYNNILPTGEDVAIDLTAYQGTNLMIAFYGESTVGDNGDNNLHIDNVSIDYIPACQKPTNFHVSSIAERSVVLSWDAPEGQNHWEVGYKTDSDPYYQWYTEPTENPYLFSGHQNRPLQPETHYTVMVRALCNGLSETSNWSKEIDFTTTEACPAPTNVTVYSTTPHGFTATFTPGAVTQTEWYFKYTTTNTTPPTDASGITTNTSFSYSNLPDLNSNTTYYLWMSTYCEEDDTYHWAEPAAFTTAEACSKVFAQDVVVEDTQPHSVTLSWEDYQGMAAQWQVYYSSYNILPYNEEYINEIAYITDDPYVTINNLYGDTDYHFWIRSYCGDWYGTPQWSQWGDMITAHTLVSCPPPTNLIAYTTANSATISWTPGGNETEWIVEITSPEWSDYLPDFTTDVPYIVFNEAFLASMWEDGICYDREFTVYVTAECGEPDGSSEPASLDFIVTDKQFLTVHNGTAISGFVPMYGGYFDDFTKSEFVLPANDLVEMNGGTITSMKFYVSSVGTGGSGWNSNQQVFMKEVDSPTLNAYSGTSGATVVWEGSLSCPTGAGELEITFTTPYTYHGGNLLVGIYNTTKSTYRFVYFYGENVDGASAANFNDSSLDNVTFVQRNFIPKTTFSFLPSCEPKTLPYVYDFEDADELACWTMVDCQSSTGITSNAAHEGDHSFRFHFNQNPPQYLISPKLECNAAISVSFYYRNYRDNYPETFQVGYSMTTKSPDAFNWGHVLTANDQNSWKLFEEIFPEGTKYVAIKLLSNNMYDLYIDDFSFMPTFCSNTNQCELTFELTDSYGDTWNGNAIKVVDERTGVVVGMMTNDYRNYDEVTHSYSAYTQIKTLSVCDDRTVRFEWISGSYPNECSYIVKDLNGEEIFYGTGAMSHPVSYTVNCDYLFVSDGEWDDSSNWSGGKVPPEGSDVIIAADAIIPEGYFVNADQVSIEGGSITVADGGQLRHNTNNLEVTMKKNIIGYGNANNQNNYYLLAFPFNDDIPVPAELIAEGCDLYMFDENNPDAEWRNYRQTPFNELQLLEGYLFASPVDMELSMTGPTMRSVNYYLPNLHASENPDNNFNGWYLLGNFYTCNAYVYTKNEDNELVPMQLMVYNEEGELVTLSGGPIPPMEGYFIKLTETTTIYFRSILDSSATPIGALKGKFTVNSNGDQVRFSQGNLQYIGSASTPYWKFADKQWETLGNNGQGSTSQYVDRDLFGWGTSAYDHGAVCYQPWSTSQTNSDYFAYNSQFRDLNYSTGKADWGYNAIRNGGNQENSGWRTLTNDEWTYLLDERSTESGIRFVLGNVNGVDGLILLPDNWNASTYTLNKTNNDYGGFNANTIGAADWTTILEANGAVFLPKTVGREGTSITTDCNYWSSTHSDINNAYCVYFGNIYVGFSNSTNDRSTGNVVRLVNPVNH